MNRKERKDIVAELLGMTPEEIKSLIKDGIKDYTTDAKTQVMAKIKEAERQSSYEYNHAREFYSKSQRVLGETRAATLNCNIAKHELAPLIERLESVKRQANAVCNNAVIDGFECNMCGCLVKNICVNGQWTKSIRYCPNCGGENIGYNS